jgi:hypothetical protein
MIDIQFRRGRAYLWQKWFHLKPSARDSVRAVHYVQARGRDGVPGFIRQPFLTPLVDLSKGEDALLESYAKNTRYEIRRAKAEGIKATIEDNLANFVKFYNRFALTKDLPPISLADVECYRPHLCVTKATQGQQLLAMHSYLVDAEEKRARLLHSACLFRVADKDGAQLIGRANRLLHHEDMGHFISQGMSYVDLGGYHAANDRELLRVNRFKDSFSGTVVQESNYLSVPLYMYRLLHDRLQTHRLR